MRVLVTGGAGYLGSVLSEHLLLRNYAVRVVDNLMYGQRSLFHLCWNPAFEFVRGDVRDEQVMRHALNGVDAVIHLAAIVGAPACDRDPLLAQTVNHDSVLLLNRLRGAGQLVVYPMTNSGYGTKSGDVLCTEETPLEPISLYARTKVEAEKALFESPNTIVLRLATVFGVSPRMRLDLLVNHFVYAAVTDGYLVVFEKHFKRNYIHIRDVADCFIHCLEHAGGMVGRAFNAGLERANLSKEELAMKVKQFVPRFYIDCAEVGSDPDKRNYIVSNERLRKAGFEARRSIESGIEELLKCYQMIDPLRTL